MLSIDDMRSPDDWGHFASLVKTPNLDRLAAMGTTFERTITQVPVCNASRSSVFTGQQPSETGILDNFTPWYQRVDAADTLPAVLRQAGAYVAMFGKNFHTDPIPAGLQPVLFDEFAYTEFDGDPTRVAADGLRHTTPFRSGRYTGPASDLRDEHAVAAALDFLENRAGDLAEPFFLSVGITKPHQDWWVPSQYFNLYNNASIRAALEASLADRTIIPGAAEFVDVPGRTNASGTQAAMAADHDLWADYIHGYLASISYADAKVGEVLDALEADPALAADTAIVMWSDNGLHLGDHDRWEKFTPWREANEVPMIIVDPDRPGGQVADQVVSLVDIFPTVLDIMGIDTPARLDLSGESLVPIVTDVDIDWYHPDSGRGVALSTVLGIISIRALVPGYGDVRYSLYPGGQEELYTLGADPNEHVNRLNYNTGKGLTARDDALHAVVRNLLEDRLADEHILISDGRTAVAGTAADELVIGATGSGSSVLRGGGGGDTYLVYKASTITEAAGGGFDSIVMQNATLEKTFVLPANVEMIEVAHVFTGNAANNWIIGTGFAGTLKGLGGNDVMRAGNGGYAIDGGDGNDDLTGEKGKDTMLGGTGNDTIAAGVGDDSLVGGSGTDVLAGEDGIDRLRGDAGADRLTGGAGNDVFVFAAAGDSTPAAADTITDFRGAGAAAGDKVDLGAIDANGTLAGNQTFAWGGAGNGHLRAIEEGTRTVLLGNTDADATAEVRIVLDDGSVRSTAYTGADFIL